MAGDWHGDTGSPLAGHPERVISEAAAAGCSWVVQLGDFGFGFDVIDPAVPGAGPAVCRFTERVSGAAVAAGVRVVFIDGNHDNHDLLAVYRQAGSRVGPERFVRLASHVSWAPRGHRWEWDGVRFGALGGASSPDRTDGRYRTAGVDWWTGEMTSAADLDALGDDPLDVLFAHDAPEIPPGLSPLPSAVATIETATNQARIAEAVARTRPAVLMHGHWHVRYTKDWARLDAAASEAAGEPVWVGARVVGLASNAEADGDRIVVTVADLAQRPQ